MRIPDDVLNEAFEERSPYVPRGMTKEDVRKLVSWIVERSIDYEAAARVWDWFEDGGDPSGAISADRRAVNAALGIGGDDG